MKKLTQSERTLQRTGAFGLKKQREGSSTSTKLLNQRHGEYSMSLVKPICQKVIASHTDRRTKRRTGKEITIHGSYYQ